MAYEIPAVTLSFPANADLSAKQYYAVKLVSGGKVDVCSAVTDVPIGILQNNPNAADKVAEVMVFGISKVNSDAAIAVGNQLGTAADGQLAVYAPGTDTTKYILGIAVLASSNAGELASALICGVPHRGA